MLTARNLPLQETNLTERGSAPIDWDALCYNDERLALTLASLRKKRDPSHNPWSLESLQNWTDDFGNPVGKSFADFWRENFDVEGDEIFRTRLLPHFPKEWLRNYGQDGKNCIQYKPCPTPMKKNDFIKEFFKHLDGICDAEELQAVASFTHSKIQKLLADRLPPDIKSVFQLKKRLNPGAAELMKKLRRKGIERTVLEQQRNEICAAVSRIMYREYIDGYVEDNIIPYCSEHEAPKRWGRASMRKWTDRQGKPMAYFYNFWMRYFKGPSEDRVFREMILPHLPETWQKGYEAMSPQPAYAWGELEPAQITDILKNLKKPSHPGKQRWRVGAVAFWTDQKGTAVGKSFLHSIQVRFGKNYAASFEQIYLPHLPKSWRTHFDGVRDYNSCPHHWEKMFRENPAELVQTLLGLERKYDPVKRTRAWGLGTLMRFKPWGRSFYQFWHEEVELYGHDAVFREKLLPYFPEEWREKYHYHAEPPRHKVPVLTPVPFQSSRQESPA